MRYATSRVDYATMLLMRAARFTPAPTHSARRAFALRHALHFHFDTAMICC